jgi:hypothetical protein
MHTGQFQSVIDVPASDTAVRDGAAHDERMELSYSRHVSDKFAQAANEAEILGAGNCAADEAIGGFHGNSVLSISVAVALRPASPTRKFRCAKFIGLPSRGKRDLSSNPPGSFMRLDLTHFDD